MTDPHPSVSIYEMVVVPGEIPVTIPEVEPTVPDVVFVLLHVPPDTPSLRVVTDPTQTFFIPVIAVGWGLTVTMVVT